MVRNNAHEATPAIQADEDPRTATDGWSAVFASRSK